ncbi:MAG: ATP-binding protein [Planctomycetes bacterium]|nr:ATP-binding protein [Planctomycetota bacterium]
MKQYGKALLARRESKHVEFKDGFDPTLPGAWCEVIKDIVAIANSGGGFIVFGLNSKGVPTGNPVADILAIDPAKVTDKVHSYTEVQFSDFEIRETMKAKKSLAVLEIGAARVPIVFTSPGTYAVEGGRQKTAFGKGTVYFRHGAKSEPATSADLGAVIDRRLAEVRREWIGGVRKVIEAPEGSRVALLPPEVRASVAPGATPIRIVNGPNADVFRLVDIDETHPYRQKELISEVHKRLPKDTVFNSFDVQVLRKVFPILETEVFSHQLRFASRQYTQSAVDWIVEQVTKDSEFLAKARAKYRVTGT